tara:strand:+ start:1007 stop:2017 length:1011 start_codon:yes stop_codon:yes gene_type:complete
MRNSFLHLCIFILSVSFSFADLIVVEGGSMISGKVIGFDTDNIIIKTDFAGTIKIDRGKILSVQSKEVFSLKLKGGKKASGSISFNGKKIRIAEDKNVSSIDFSEVVSITPKSEKIPGRKWSFNTGFDLLGKQGNTEELSLGANLVVLRKGPKDELKFNLEYEDREKNTEKTADRIGGGVAYEYFFKDSLGWYLRSELESDDVTAVNLRSTTGAGASYRLLNRDKQTLVARSGLGYRFTDYDTGKKEESSMTLDLGVTHKYQFNDSISFDTDLSYVPGIGGSGNNRFVHDSAMVMPVGTSGKWSLKMGVKNEYETEPAVLEKLDTTYYSRMSFSWD